MVNSTQLKSIGAI